MQSLNISKSVRPNQPSIPAGRPDHTLAERTKEQRRKIIGRLNEEAKSRFVAPYAKALVLNALGEKPLRHR